MDVQTVSCWIKAVLSKPEAPVLAQWTQAFILFITAGIVCWYTKETCRLRKEAQRQTELQLRPFVILEATPSGFQVRNVGNGTAINIKVGDVLVKLREHLAGVISFPESVPALSKGEYIPVQYKSRVDGVENKPEFDPYVRVLLPSLTQVTKDLPISKPEITIEFRNVER